ncbi:MAG: hypothetical protein WD733_15800 [Bryobacterales bacterium]
MARNARVVVEGVPHHITQRGNNRQDVFLVDEDRRFYIQTLRDKCQQHGVVVGLLPDDESHAGAVDPFPQQTTNAALHVDR